MGEFVFEGDDGVRLRVWRHATWEKCGRHGDTVGHGHGNLLVLLVACRGLEPGQATQRRDASESALQPLMCHELRNPEPHWSRTPVRRVTDASAPVHRPPCPDAAAPWPMRCPRPAGPAAPGPGRPRAGPGARAARRRGGTPTPGQPRMSREHATDAIAGFHTSMLNTIGITPE